MTRRQRRQVRRVGIDLAFAAVVLASAALLAVTVWNITGDPLTMKYSDANFYPSDEGACPTGGRKP